MANHHEQPSVGDYLSQDRQPNAKRCHPCVTAGNYLCDMERYPENCSFCVGTKKNCTKSGNTIDTYWHRVKGYAPAWPGRYPPPRPVLGRPDAPMRQFGAGQITQGFNPQTNPLMPHIILHVGPQSEPRQKDGRRRNNNGNKRARHAPKEDHERAELLKAVKEMKEEITTLKQDRSRAQEDARRFDDHNRNFPMTSDRGRDHVCERSPSPKGRSGYPSRSKPPGQEYRDRHDNRPRRRRPDDEEPEAAHMTRLTSRPPSQREASRSTNPRQRVYPDDDDLGHEALRTPNTRLPSQREAFRSTNPRQRVYPDDDDFGHRARTTQHDNGRIELFPEKIAVKAEEEQQPPGPRFKETFKRRVAGDGLGDRGRIVNKEYTIHDDNGSRSSHKGFGELARQGEQSDR